MPAPRFAFAGDRSIAVEVLDYLIGQGHRPLALLLAAPPGASHAEALRRRCSFLEEEVVFEGKSTGPIAETLARLDLDYIVSVHYPHILPRSVLDVPRHGVLNLHPAYLPFNRGWHTPSWAILDDTPIGATLHLMDEGVDSGPVISRREVALDPGDTAHSLYQRVLAAEVELFKETWPTLVAGNHEVTAQDEEGTLHRKKDLLQPAVRRLDLDTPATPREILRRLRALTTNDPAEAAYFDADGKRYRVRVSIEEDTPTAES